MRSLAETRGRSNRVRADARIQSRQAGVRSGDGRWAAAAARLGTAVAKGLGCARDGADLAANYVWQPDEVAAKADQMYN